MLKSIENFFVTLGKFLERGREAEVGEEGRAVTSEHRGLGRVLISAHQVKSAQEPFIACCSMVLLSEYIFHGPPASVTN